MRPRMNSTFGVMKWKDLKDYFFNNYVFSFTVDINGNELTYMSYIMFRSNKKDPEKIYVKVSRTSKNVIGAWTDNKKFNSIQEILDYTKR